MIDERKLTLAGWKVERDGTLHDVAVLRIAAYEHDKAAVKGAAAIATALAKVFDAHGLRPMRATIGGTFPAHLFVFTADAPVKFVNGFKPTPQRVARFNDSMHSEIVASDIPVFGDREEIRISLGTELALDGCTWEVVNKAERSPATVKRADAAEFPYAISEYVGADLRSALDKLHGEGAFKWRSEGEQTAFANTAQRTQQERDRLAKLEAFFNEHRGPQEQVELIELWEKCYARHNQAAA